MNEPEETGRKRNFLVVLAVILLGIGLSLGLVVRDQPNYQERYDVGVSQQALSVGSLGSNDDPMPLYFLLLHGWLRIFSSVSISALTAARLLSLVFYVFSVAAAYFLGKSSTNNKRSGLFGAALLGLSPFMIWYGNRASMYLLLVLAALINQYFFTKILDKPAWWAWPCYLLSGLFALGVHYFFAIMLILQLIFYAVKTHSVARRHMEPALMAACMIIFVLAFGAWTHFSSDHTNFWQYLPFTSRPSATNTFIIYVQYLFGFQSVLTTTLLISFWPLLVILALLGIQKYVAPPVGVQYSVWAATVPIIAMFALGWIWKPLFLSSYLIVCLPALMIFLGWYFSAFKLKTLSLAFGVVIIVMLVTLSIEIANPSRAIQNDYLGLLAHYSKLP